MSTFQGTCFDGETMRPHAITAELGDGWQLSVRGETVNFTVPISEVRISDRLGHTSRYLYLPDNRTIETLDNEAVDTALASQRQGRWAALIHWLEARTSLAVGATLLLIGSVTAGLIFGLPALARRGAALVPAAVEAEAGRAALATLNQIVGPSQLKPGDQQRVQRQLGRILAKRPQPGPVRIEFRTMGGIPNAFALPGGIIVVSDELVKMALFDEELAAVLAHEVGHLEKHHGLQSVLRNSFALLVVTTLTGDLSTLTTFSGTLPLLLLQTGYVREFEREADAYAIEALHAAGIKPFFFATILEKLEKARPAEGQDFTYLSTHPGTDERIKKIRASK